jgi:putative acetyltransferase
MDISIRRVEPSDYELIARHMADPLVFPGTLQLPHPSAEMWRKRLAETPDSDYILVARSGDTFLGFAGLHAAARSPRRSHAMFLGITVGSEHQGQGVGRALMAALLDLADNWLNVFRIELTVFTDNQRAIALYRHFGFEVEGTHRAYALRDGRYCDTHSMARVRPKTPAV